MIFTSQLLREVVHYLRHDRETFHEEAAKGERVAERAYQSSMQSAVEVARNARRMRTNAEFIKEVVKGSDDAGD